MEQVNHSKSHSHNTQNVKQLAFSATTHCLTGCAIGEVLGMVLGNVFLWSALTTIIVAVILAFFFGYLLTLLPLLRSGINLIKALPLAFASDTISITIMEIIDNVIMVFIPGAMDAPITSLLFWGSLIVAFALAFVAAFPVNIYLISKGKGHAVIHKHH